MHVLFISDNFYPESNALANRLYDHARTWVKAGHQVTIVTCAPNFPHGKVYPGYKNEWRFTEEIDGINVIRIKSYMAENKGALRRIIDFISFGLHAAVQGLFVKKPDIVIGSSPQPFSVFAAWFIAKLKRKPFIFEIRDLWPESVVAVDAMGKHNILLQFFGWMIKHMYRAADVIVSVTDSFKTQLAQQHVNPAKIIIAKNGINIDEINPSISKAFLREKYQLQNKFVAGYIGTIGMAHDVMTLVRAAKLNLDPQVHFVIMGAGAQADEVKQQAAELTNVTFIDKGTRQEALDVLNMLDVSIVHLKDTPLFRRVIPSKIFEIMALGKPILMGVKGESRDIVIEQAKAGYAFEPENPKSLNAALAKLQKETYHPEFAMAFVKQHFNRANIATIMLQDIEQHLRKVRPYAKN